MKSVVVLDLEDVAELITLLRQVSIMHPLDTDLTGNAARQWIAKLLPFYTQPKERAHVYPQNLEG